MTSPKATCNKKEKAVNKKINQLNLNTYLPSNDGVAAAVIKKNL